MKRNHPEGDNAIDISAARLEGAEAEFMYQYESMAPRSAATSLDIETARIGGGVVLSMRSDPKGYWRKALGFGPLPLGVGWPNVRCDLEVGARGGSR